MNAVLRHLIVLPIVVPLVTGALLMFLAEARRTLRVTLAVASVLTERVSVTDASAAWRAGRARPRLGEEAVLIILHAASLGALMAWAVTWLGA